ncbi:hypothetical protein IHV25_06990 [Phaeovibrio sulfidiphilus]|uniref:Uncharacterized protein n=1 Tax=Phaeovibrio sulfidiphilus TaxID=1220600 RepID=A0A8J6YPQ5_9PROT|nr:hypothetical protein [Phaeovibrio sulfidiphilus]MBE1237391.1 hypothetical protein [Phaeovibrio sulfidiphilus]
MNLRISGQSLRFRIDPDECDRLLDGGTVSSLTRLPSGSSLEIRLRARSLDQDVLSLEEVDATALELLVDWGALGDLMARHPRITGLSSRPDTPDGDPLELSLEIDVGFPRGRVRRPR